MVTIQFSRKAIFTIRILAINNIWIEVDLLCHNLIKAKVWIAIKQHLEDLLKTYNTHLTKSSIALEDLCNITVMVHLCTTMMRISLQTQTSFRMIYNLLSWMLIFRTLKSGYHQIDIVMSWEEEIWKTRWLEILV